MKCSSMNILILKVSAIGDVIHTLPAIFYLKKCFPDAKISWVVQKKAADLLLNQPFLDNVFVLPDKFLHPQNWLTSCKVIKDLRKTEWDAILDFQGIHKTCAIIAFLKGKKFGFSSQLARSKFSTWFTDFHVDVEFKNIIQKNLALTSHAVQVLHTAQNLCPSILELKKTFEFKFGETEMQAVDQWLAANQITGSPGIGNFILLCPNTTKKSKHWPEEFWVEFIEMADRQDDKKILLVGQQFGQAADNIAQLCQKKALPILIVPAWNLNATAYLISKADLLIAPDTGLLHLADFLDTTTIGIFGPTRKELQGPFLKDINIKNAIQTDDLTQTGFQADNSTNESNFQKSTSYQSNMYKLKPNVLLEQVLNILKK